MLAITRTENSIHVRDVLEIGLINDRHPRANYMLVDSDSEDVAVQVLWRVEDRYGIDCDTWLDKLNELVDLETVGLDEDLLRLAKMDIE